MHCCFQNYELGFQNLDFVLQIFDFSKNLRCFKKQYTGEGIHDFLPTRHRHDVGMHMHAYIVAHETEQRRHADIVAHKTTICL